MIFLRNLLRARLRSVMTVLGITVGVGLYVASAAITGDLRQQIGTAVQAYGFDVVVHERRAPSPFSSRITQDQMAALQARYGSLLSPMVMGTLNEPWNPYALVLGVEPAFTHRVPLVSGRSFEPGSAEVMVGEIAAGKLGASPGSRITVGGETWTVSGIYRTGSRLFDGGVMGEISAMQRPFTPEGTEPHYTMALLTTGDRTSTDRVMHEVAVDFPKLKAIPGTEFAGAVRLLRVVEAFVGTIGIVVLIGTALLVTHMLMMAVAERTREIGILMAVGWRPRLVLRMLAAETAVLCVIGALLGNVAGMGLLRGLNQVRAIGLGWLPVDLSLKLVGQSLELMAVVAAISLLWPAVVLLRMQPLSALRHA